MAGLKLGKENDWNPVWVDADEAPYRIACSRST